MLSSEIYPYAKTGGLADFCHCLIKYLRKSGIDAKGVMPFYKGVNVQHVRELARDIEIVLDGEKHKFSFLETEECIFIDCPVLYHRDYLYGPPGQGYSDNDIRFGGFCWAVFKAIERGILQADLVHCNDWQTALFPVLQKVCGLRDLKTVLTIHNLGYQGIFPKASLNRLSLPDFLFDIEALEFWGQVNFFEGRNSLFGCPYNGKSYLC